MIATLFLAALPSALPAVQDDFDLLVLQDGKEIACRVLFENEEKIVYRAKRKNQEIALAEVAKIHTIERSLRKFFKQFEELGPKAVEGMLDLASFCESRDLAGEARNMRIRVILIDPENENAWTELGGNLGRRGWRLRVRGRYYTLDQLKERVSDWKNAMELRTAHFLLKTDIEPTRALNVTLDLERAYIKFYDLLGPHLELYVFDEIPEIHVFSDSANYPTPPDPRNAWFSRTANTLYVDASKDVNSHEIVQNLTYCLLFNAFHRTLGKSGSVSPWAREGLAQAFGAAVRPDPGKVRWETGVPYLPYFESHAADEKALSLDQVLRAGLASFNSGTDAYRYTTQAYTLAFFLVHASDGKYKAGFAEFLRSSFLGQGSATHFRKILDVDLGELETEWIGYVKTIAGA